MSRPDRRIPVRTPLNWCGVAESDWSTIALAFTAWSGVALTLVGRPVRKETLEGSWITRHTVVVSGVAPIALRAGPRRPISGPCIEVLRQITEMSWHPSGERTDTELLLPKLQPSATAISGGTP